MLTDGGAELDCRERIVRMEIKVSGAYSGDDRRIAILGAF